MPKDPEAAEGSSSVISLGNQNVFRADSDGIVLYSMDGYEGKTVDTLTAADFDQNAYHETDLKTDGAVEAGDDIYTLITDERWSLLIPLSSKQATKLSDRTSVRVKFLKDGMTQSGDFSIIEIEGQQYGKIDFNKGLIRYASDRFLEIELVTNTVTGLKIPLSSIVTKEFYKIPSEYLTQNEKTQESGFTVTSVNDDGNEVDTFVTTTIYAGIEADAGGGESTTVYYVDKEDFQEGDVIENQTKRRPLRCEGRRRTGGRILHQSGLRRVPQDRTSGIRMKNTPLFPGIHLMAFLFMTILCGTQMR